MATAAKPRAARKATTIKSPEPLAPIATPAASTAPTKQAQLVNLLRRDGGATITELAAELNWLPHTTRAALSGLRKKGHDIVKSKVDDVTRYSIAPVTTA